MGRESREGRQPIIGVLLCHFPQWVTETPQGSTRSWCKTHSSEGSYPREEGAGYLYPISGASLVGATPRDVLDRHPEAAWPCPLWNVRSERRVKHWQGVSHTFSAVLWSRRNSLICEKPRMDDVWLTVSLTSADRHANSWKIPTPFHGVWNLCHKSPVSRGHQENVSALPRRSNK